MAKKIKFVTVVWGAEYTQTYLDVVLPNQLTPGNLAHLGSNPNASYHIYTSSADFTAIRSSAAYDELRQLMPVELHAIEPEIVKSIKDGNKYLIMSACHSDALTSSKHEETVFIFPPPDQVWSEGCFQRLLEIESSGKRIVYVAGLRVVKETFLAELAARNQSSSKLQLSPRQLCSLTFKHLHPDTQNSMWNTDRANSGCSGLLWQIDDQTLLAHYFHLHPLLINPANRDAVPEVSIDDKYGLEACPDESQIYVVQDSDDLCGFEMSQIDLANTTLNDSGYTTTQVANWSYKNTDERHRELFRNSIIIHAGELPKNLLPKIRESGRIIEKCLEAHFQIVEELNINSFFGHLLALNDAMRQADHEEAFACCLEIRRERPRSVISYVAIAQFSLMNGDTAGAIYALETAMSLSQKNDPGIVVPLSYAYLADGQTEKGEELLLRIADSKKFNRRTSKLLAQIAERKGDKGQALKHQLEIIRYNSDDPYAWSCCAQLARDVGDISLANMAFATAERGLQALNQKNPNQDVDQRQARSSSTAN